MRIRQPASTRSPLQISVKRLIIVVFVVPIATGAGMWFLSYFTWAAHAEDQPLTSLAWVVMTIVVTLSAGMFTEFVRFTSRMVNDAIVAQREASEKIEQVEQQIDIELTSAASVITQAVGQEVMRSALQLRDAGTVAHHVTDVFAQCEQLQHFLLLMQRLVDQSISQSFSKDGIIRRYDVGDAEYCSLLMEACRLAKDSIQFTCLESPYWFMLGHESRQVHLQAMNDRELPRVRKSRIVKLSHEPEEPLLTGSDDRFAEANKQPQFIAVYERDKSRGNDEESEVAWFMRQSNNTTLYWTTTSLLPTNLASVEDYGILDGILYLSYDFRNRILSCSWNPSVIEASLEIFRVAEREAVQPSDKRSMFFDYFHELPALPHGLKQRYIAEINTKKTAAE